MSDTDVYEYVAIVTIMHSGVVAYQPGDPVPGDNVKANGYEVGSAVVLRKDYKADDHGPAIAAVDPDQPTERGQMPKNLRGGPEKLSKGSESGGDTTTPARGGKAATGK
jgi:hypothetical protein